eukprot:4568782-Pleurochrysis_carterae.AAC.1
MHGARTVHMRCVPAVRASRACGRCVGPRCPHSAERDGLTPACTKRLKDHARCVAHRRAGPRLVVDDGVL